MVCSDRRAVRSVSPGSDGERVGVVGEDRPLSPDLLAFVALEARSPQSVAAFEVADPSFRAGSVLAQPALAAFGAVLLAASDEHCLRSQVLDRRAGQLALEPAVEPG